jgi:hypothetical protein
MPERSHAAERSPQAAITAAQAQIEAAYPALVFADERATDEAGEGFRRALRIIRYQLRRDIPATTILPPSVP